MATTTAPPSGKPPSEELEKLLPEYRVAPPPPLGKPPSNISSLFVNMPGTKGTHFTGPVVSGPTPGRLDGIRGAAQLNAAFRVDYSMGNFSLPVQFPLGSFVFSGYAITYQTFTAAPSVSLGTQTGLANVLGALALPAQGASVTGQVLAPLPIWEVNPPLFPFRGWLNVTGNTGTAGGGIVIVTYAVLAQPWT